MEQKLLRLAWLIALCMAGVFTAYLLDETLRPIKTDTRVKDLRTEMHGGGHRVYYLTTHTQHVYEITDIEYYGLRFGDPVSIFETHWFKAKKGWYGKSFQNGKVLGENGDGGPRTGWVIIYIISIILGLLALRTKRFEFRITITFFLLILSAFKYWFGDVL